MHITEKPNRKEKLKQHSQRRVSCLVFLALILFYRRWVGGNYLFP